MQRQHLRGQEHGQVFARGFGAAAEEGVERRGGGTFLAELVKGFVHVHRGIEVLVMDEPFHDNIDDRRGNGATGLAEMANILEGNVGVVWRFAEVKVDGTHGCIGGWDA